MNRPEALLKLLSVEPETRPRLIVVTGWDAEETESVLDGLVQEGKVTYRNGKQGDTHGQRLYYPTKESGLPSLPGPTGKSRGGVRDTCSGQLRGKRALDSALSGQTDSQRSGAKEA